ncbi:hypothetical protein THOM_0745 [Trachipleistophora hominis]|uniref:Uncharacterized protein n=1 Tax=Trachipleistophora hominis TaxID=72359 RepID=L7JYB2_TRAHO|nr:hypothetical protein THOM_0745 [Trachipleistophora hominis]
MVSILNFTNQGNISFSSRGTPITHMSETHTLTHEELVAKNISEMIRECGFRNTVDSALDEIIRTHPKVFICVIMFLYIIAILLLGYGIRYARKSFKKSCDLRSGRNQDIGVFAVKIDSYNNENEIYTVSNSYGGIKTKNL